MQRVPESNQGNHDALSSPGVDDAVNPTSTPMDDATNPKSIPTTVGPSTSSSPAASRLLPRDISSFDVVDCAMAAEDQLIPDSNLTMYGDGGGLVASTSSLGDAESYIYAMSFPAHMAAPLGGGGGDAVRVVVDGGVDKATNPADSFMDDSSHRRGPSDLGIGPSSGPSESVCVESNKEASFRGGNSSSGTILVETSGLHSSESAKQRGVSLSKTKLGFIREKLRELKSLIPPPAVPDVSHTAVALQVARD